MSRLAHLLAAIRSYARYRDLPAAYGLAEAVHAFTGRRACTCAAEDDPCCPMHGCTCSSVAAHLVNPCTWGRP